MLVENRSGLVVGAVVTHADGMGERAAALAMLDALPGKRARTIAADKAYDTRDFIDACRKRHVTPHVAPNDTRNGGSAIDGRTTRHSGYAISQTVRKRIEEHFGWGKTVGGIRQTLYRGIRRVDQHFKLPMTASNIVRMARKLCVELLPDFLKFFDGTAFRITQGGRLATASAFARITRSSSDPNARRRRTWCSRASASKAVPCRAISLAPAARPSAGATRHRVTFCARSMTSRHPTLSKSEPSSASSSSRATAGAVLLANCWRQRVMGFASRGFVLRRLTREPPALLLQRTTSVR